MRAHRYGEGEAVGLLPTPRDRQGPGRLPMTVGDRPIAREDVWTLLAVAYVGWDGRGAGPADVRDLARAIRRGEGRGLRASLLRLRDAGLVDEADGAYRASAAVVAFLGARTHRRGIWHDFRDLLLHLAHD